MERLERLWRLALLLALILSAVSIAASQWERRGALSRTGRLIDLVHTARPVAPGAILTEDDLEVRRLPALYAPSARLEALAGAVGRTAAHALPPGVPLRPGDFVAPPPLRAGERLISLALDGSLAWGGLLRAGDHVDVLAAYSLEGTPTTAVIVPDAVLHQAPPPSTSQGFDPERILASSGQEESVSLLVSSEQALRIAHALAFGQRLMLILRPPAEPAGWVPQPIRGMP